MQDARFDSHLTGCQNLYRVKKKKKGYFFLIGSFGRFRVPKKCVEAEKRIPRATFEISEWQDVECGC